MTVLAIDSSSSTAAAAVIRDGQTAASRFADAGLTHSETLLPMICGCVSEAGIAPEEIDKVAVTAGPGSFTGVRIGVATAKGYAMGCGACAAGVSTLEALAWNLRGEPDGTLVCPVLDARCGQVYCALFRIEDHRPGRLFEDRAVPAAELTGELGAYNERVIFCGDGAHLFFDGNGRADFIMAPYESRYVTGTGVWLASEGAPEQTPGELKPFYLRPSQAEREYAKGRLKNVGIGS